MNIIKWSFKQLSVIGGLSMLPVLLFSQDTAKAYLDYEHSPATSILPNFSYVGYHNGELPIPENTQLKVFNVTDFGAKPDDGISDKNAIRKAIKAAENNGGGIVLFPKGRFLVNEEEDDKDQIVISASNIILRGSGSGEGGTELFMKNTLSPKDSTKMWTVPSLFATTSREKTVSVGRISNNVAIGSTSIYLQKPADIKPGEWLQIRMRSNDPSLIKKEMGIHEADSSWTSLVKDGAFIKMYFQVKEVSNNHILLNAPIPYEIDAKYPWAVYKFANISEVGLENLAFVGNWKDSFVHHRSWKDDSGFSLWHFNNTVNSWVINCRFTDANVGLTIGDCANITVLNCTVTGNPGHEAISNTGGTNVLLANINQIASTWHSVGVANTSMNTVIYKANYPSTSSFETHSSQPRNTLLDGVTGGLLNNRGGGAISNMPNHMSNLVFWNYKQTNTANNPFDFWPKTSWYWKIPMPVVVGFTGGTTFIHEQLKYEESTGKAVLPGSLYEAQYKLRLGKLPDWLKK